MRLRECLLRNARPKERGVSILIVAVGMVFVLGMAGLGVDLASLYVGRTQAQRAADAGALAGAQKLVTLGCTSSVGPDISPGCIDAAKVRAAAVANRNLIAGVSPDVDPTNQNDVKFLSTSVNDPIIQVEAARDTSHDNPMPTFFIKIFGIDHANVSATAKAEAYNPPASGSSVGATCVKPWLLPNCDPDHTDTTGTNTACPGYAYYINPTTKQIQNPGPYASGGVQGEQITIKPGDPNGGATAAPGKFWPVFLPVGSVASMCPSCANTATGGGTGTGSGQLYRYNIECCNNTVISCGPNTVQPITGNMVGPTEQGVNCLIHQYSKTNISGMDLFNPATWTMTGGSNNPDPSLINQPIDSSDSMVTIPVYDGTVLCPGTSCPATVQVDVIGFIQLFIAYEDGSNNGNVIAYVMNVSAGACSTGGTTPGTPEIVTGGSSPIPVRLIE